MKRVISFCAKDKAALNALADAILLKKPALAEEDGRLELTTGRATLFGSGEKQIVRITLTYENPTEAELQDIEEIIAIAKNFGGDGGASVIDIHIDDE